MAIVSSEHPAIGTARTQEPRADVPFEIEAVLDEISRRRLTAVRFRAQVAGFPRLFGFCHITLSDNATMLKSAAGRLLQSASSKRETFHWRLTELGMIPSRT